MSVLYRFVQLVSVGALCLATCSAQDGDKKKASGSPAMQKPVPAPEFEGMKKELLGKWSVQEKFEPSPWMASGGEGTGESTVTLGPGGMSLIMNYKNLKGPMPGFTGLGVLSFDPDDKAFQMFWTDSMSPAGMLETGHMEGNNVVYTGKAKMMGKPVSVKDVISDRTPNSYTMTSYMGDGGGGEMKKTMTLKYTKKK